MATSTIKAEADYIVEQGTSGNWTYRKWNSGWAEAWGVVSLASAAFSASGNIYYRQITNNAYPSGVFKESGVKYGFANSQFGNIGAATLGIGASDFSLTVLSAVSTARNVTVFVYLKGEWR